MDEVRLVDVNKISAVICNDTAQLYNRNAILTRIENLPAQYVVSLSSKDIIALRYDGHKLKLEELQKIYDSFCAAYPDNTVIMFPSELTLSKLTEDELISWYKAILQKLERVVQKRDLHNRRHSFRLSSFFNTKISGAKGDDQG